MQFVLKFKKKSVFKNRNIEISIGKQKNIK